ncbi:MAG TPA: MarR family transcriptional regulator [Micropepsaceae bacterium]|nr:MarR family transcriptional regulator [Micropepsaceae bacterium]HRK70102.1 MarR family transcriptional regulator [Micropepsaceae bacterium]
MASRSGKTSANSHIPLSQLLRRCHQLADDLYAAEAGKGGLTARQHAVLAAINTHNGASQASLVDATGIDRSTLAEMLSRLIARDYVTRKRLTEDARANAVRLTPKGLRAIKAMANAASRTEAKLMAAVPAPKRGELIKALAAIAALSDAKD